MTKLSIIYAPESPISDILYLPNKVFVPLFAGIWIFNKFIHKFTTFIC